MKTIKFIIGVSSILMMMVTTIIAQNISDTNIRVTGAWARPGEGMSAAYLQIHNDSPTHDDQLVAVRLESGHAEIHETQIENDVMRMRLAEIIEIPAGATIRLQPGGYHIMLMELENPLTEGDNFPLTLIFESGEEISVEAIISQTPIPNELEADALTELAQVAVANEQYVGQVVDPPIQVQDFQAPASDDDLNHLSDTNGTWRVIFFGYMHCPDFCPLTLVDYHQAKALLGNSAHNVTFMFISVDSVRDTPNAIRRYLDNFDSDFIGFSPDDMTLSQIQPDYGFYYQRRLDEDTQSIYTIDHSTRSYLLDRDGVLRASFAYDTDPQMIADALLWYLENE